MAKLQFTQENIDQGDAFGMTEGTDYELVAGAPLDEDDDLGPTDVDTSDLGLPQMEADGGKLEASDSPEGDKEAAKADSGDDDKDEDKDGDDDSDDTDPDDDEPLAAKGDDAADAAADGSATEGDAGADAESTVSPQLPKYRYDQQKAKAQRLADENATLQQQLDDLKAAQQQAAQAAPAPKAEPAPEPVDTTAQQRELEEQIDALLVKKNEALVDSDPIVAARYERDVMTASAKLTALRTPAPAVDTKPQLDPEAIKAEARAEFRAEQEMNAALDNLVDEYDVLDENGETYDKVKVGRILRMQRINIEDGMSPVEAIIDAAETVLAGVVPKSQRTAGKPDAKTTPARKTDVQKNVTAAKNQPPTLDDSIGDASDTAGMKDDLPDIDKLTDEEFDKLPLHIQERMAGNVVH